MATNDNVAYFNHVHNTSYDKKQIDGIYWLCDIYKMKTADGISYSQNCHHCGKQIETIGNEFCGPDCKLMYNLFTMWKLRSIEAGRKSAGGGGRGRGGGWFPKQRYIPDPSLKRQIPRGPQAVQVLEHRT